MGLGGGGVPTQEHTCTRWRVPALSPKKKRRRSRALKNCGCPEERPVFAPMASVAHLAVCLTCPASTQLTCLPWTINNVLRERLPTIKLNVCVVCNCLHLCRGHLRQDNAHSSMLTLPSKRTIIVPCFRGFWPLGSARPVADFGPIPSFEQERGRSG